MKIKITKFKTIENLTIEVPAQIKGGNGLGKSTILEAISFVLTGKNLDGKEFEQVYDNRVDLHDAIADVSYFDNYGNEFQRIVKPIFQTNRAGVEEIKIKRSTECRKNGIVVNDFSDEFQDFYKFGTDYFFNQKEDVQRQIFIDILKSKLPDYDVNSASLKLKELKKSQKIEVDLVKGLQDANKNTKDVEVPIIPADIEKLNSEYLALQNASNPDAIAEINKKNNDAMSAYLKRKGEISSEISEIEISIKKVERDIEVESENLEKLKNEKFTPKTTEPTDVLEKEILFLKSNLKSLEYFENIGDYAAKYFNQNPILVENSAKIQDILSEKIEISNSNCPLTNEFCKIASENSKKAEVEKLKAQNRSILEKEMHAINSEYNVVKSDLQEAERKLNKVIDSNKQIESDNEFLKKSFEIENKKCDEEQNLKIEILNKDLYRLKDEWSIVNGKLAILQEPTPEKLPEQLEISDELKQAHIDFETINEQIIGAKAINANNAKLITERSNEIKEKQANLLQIIEQITTLTTEISDYFSNLTNIVKSEFAGDIEIDVELLEYVMNRGEYKDCFKITANGKVFPYECNGALQNNVKMQILYNLQRLKGYTGVTVMDNCEANTTQPINTLGLNCVLAYATNDNQLVIK